MIQIRGLQFAYPGGDFRLQVPDLAIETGRKTALIGPSGSGEMGVQSVVFDPCGNTPEGIDYIAVMHENLSSLGEGLGGVSPPAARFKAGFFDSLFAAR